MKILFWNVRDMGRPSKSHLVKDLLISTKADIVCLQETKLQELYCSMWKSIGGRFLDSFNYIPTIGMIVGIVMN